MPLVTVRDISQVGRFGNQLFLYVFAKAYALAHGCDLEVGTWIGRDVFKDANEPKPSRILPQTQLDSKDPKRLGYFFGKKDIDIFVYGQHQCYLDYYTRKQVREWLAIQPRHIWADNHHVPCVAHLRRGDYLTKYAEFYCLVMEKSYTRAVKQFQLPEPVYLSDERPPKLWLEDFLTMRDADVLLRANSSFSWWAGTLGYGTVYSPVVGAKSGWQDVPFIESNHPCTAGRFANQSDLVLKEE